MKKGNKAEENLSPTDFYSNSWLAKEAEQMDTCTIKQPQKRVAEDIKVTFIFTSMNSIKNVCCVLRQIVEAQKPKRIIKLDTSGHKERAKSSAIS